MLDFSCFKAAFLWTFLHLSHSCKHYVSVELKMTLKVGSWSFEGIIILLIYFLNCQKALFTKKSVSFSKKYRVQKVRLAVLRGIP